MEPVTIIMIISACVGAIVSIINAIANARKSAQPDNPLGLKKV